MTGSPSAPLDSVDERKHRRQLAAVLEALRKGHLDNTGTVTFSTSTSVTTITDGRIAYDSLILLMPTTLNAAAAVPTTYVPASGRVNGAVVVTHANNTQTDRIFRYAVIG